MKRSRKRSKLLSSSNATPSLISASSVKSVLAHLTSHSNASNNPDLSKKLTSGKQTKLAATKKEKKEKSKVPHAPKKIESNFEPVSKKFAVDSDPSIGPQMTSINLMTKKEDVELHIKELSLLDLHSSEDDSADRLARFHKDAESSSNPDTDPPKSMKEQRRINKLIQYWKKSSLDSTDKADSDTAPIKKKINAKSDTKSIISLPLLVQSDSNLYNNQNQQNKRKKNNCNNELYSSNSNSPTLSSSLISVSSSFPSCLSESYSDNNLNHNNNNKKPTSRIPDPTLDNDTLQHMKNLDLNQEDLSSFNEKSSAYLTTASSFNSINSTTSSFQSSTSSLVVNEQTASKQSDSGASNSSLNINLNDKYSRKSLWNLLKSHSSLDEMLDQFGTALHDKISFWDLVQLKLKYSKKSELKTTYEIIDDYTLLYSNMSTLLEGFVKEHSSETCSRSRSSSRNYRKL